jgi:signal peptidase I
MRGATATSGSVVDKESPGWMRRIAKTGLNLLVLAVAVFSLFVAYGTMVDNRWYKIVAIDGGSMSPSIRQGDAILVTRPPATLKEGMIVVLQVNGRLVTHRVVTVRRDGSFTTKGDANDHADDWRNTDVRIAGLVRGHVPFLGRVLTVGSGTWLNDQLDVPVNVTAG